MSEKENIEKEVPHPKSEEELKKILEETEEFGGPKDGTTKYGDWNAKGKAVDFS